MPAFAWKSLDVLSLDILLCPEMIACQDKRGIDFRVQISAGLASYSGMNALQPRGLD